MKLDVLMGKSAEEEKTIYHGLCDEQALLEITTIYGFKCKGKIIKVETTLYPGGIWLKEWEYNDHFPGHYSENNKSTYFIPFSLIHIVRCDEVYKKSQQD